MGNYWLHRISHCWDISKVLLEKGFLTIGWQKYSDFSMVNSIENGSNKFLNCMDELGEKSKSRWNLWNFGNMNEGDTIIIPLYERDFAIATVEESMKPISELPLKGGITSLSKRKVIMKDNALCYEDTEEIIDIGFFIKIKDLQKKARNYAWNELQARMKMFQCNAKINDLEEFIEEAKVANAPINVHDKIFDVTSKPLKKVLQKSITPDQFENLIKWYLEKLGASRTKKPNKNDSTKKNGADADIIAEFDKLGIAICIQAKQYVGDTNDNALKQIYEYSKQKSYMDGVEYIPWVISTGNYSTEVMDKAKILNIRLIDGNQFVEMLLDMGIHDVNKIVN